jgi:hypothetical protein
MAYPVKYFTSAMPGVPVLANNWGDLIGVLDACLVTGFNLKAIDSLVRVGTTVTATVAAGHPYKTDQIVRVAGADQAAYNGEVAVTSFTANTFTYEVTGAPATPATSTAGLSCKVAPLGWEKAFSGTHKAAYRSLDVQSNRHYLRVDDSLKTNKGFGDYDTSWAKWAGVTICEGMTDIDTIVGAQAPYDPNAPLQNIQSIQPGHFGWHKWYHGCQTGYELYGDGGAGARNWVLVGDGRLFYLITTTAPGGGFGGRAMYCFGDFTSTKSGDAYATLLKAHDRYWSNSNTYMPNVGEAGGQDLLVSNAAGGTSLLKNHTQIGGGVRFGLTSINTNNSTQVCGRGTMPFPHGPDFSLWLLPAYIRQEDGNFRGVMPGMRWLPQDRPFGDLTLVDNVAGEPGKKFLLVRQHYGADAEGAQAAFDVTGPWR